jgi:hypothetical protein
MKIAKTSAIAGQRLLAAGQQVDRRVLLAGRLRHHLHAGVEDLVARHHQLRVAAAEQAREHAAELLVDQVEGLHQQVARLEVDLVDRAFERGDRLVQVGVLRVEEGLALARGAELVERREVDGAERVDVAADAVDLALQAVELDAVLLDALASASRSTSAATSCSMYCAPPSCAACSSSCSLVIVSRSGCRLRSNSMRCSSARRSCAERSSYSLRATFSAPSRAIATRARPAGPTARPGR